MALGPPSTTTKLGKFNPLALSQIKQNPLSASYLAFISILNLIFLSVKSSTLNNAILHSLALSLFNFLNDLSALYSLFNFFYSFLSKCYYNLSATYFFVSASALLGSIIASVPITLIKLDNFTFGGGAFANPNLILSYFSFSLSALFYLLNFFLSYFVKYIGITALYYVFANLNGSGCSINNVIFLLLYVSSLNSYVLNYSSVSLIFYSFHSAYLPS